MKARHEFGTTEQWYDYLRTYFASHAMSGLMASAKGGFDSTQHMASEASELSVLVAESLLKELQK